MSTPQNYCWECLCPHSEPQLPLPTTTFTGDPPIAGGRSGPGSCDVTAFYPGSWGTWGLVCTLQEWSFCLPQSCGIPVIKPTGHQSQMLSGLLFPMPDPQAVEPGMGLGSFTSVGEPLHYNNFLLLWVTHLGGNEIWFDCNCAPILPSCCVYICLWIQDIFFGRFQCFVFCCCSAVSCDLVFSWDGMSTCPSTFPSCLYPLNVSLICLKVKDMS